MTEEEAQQKVAELYEVIKAMWPYVVEDIKRSEYMTPQQFVNASIHPEYQRLRERKAAIEGELIPLVGQDTLYGWISKYWERDD